MIDFGKLDAKDWLTLNAGLQKKKNALRKELSERGVLQKQGNNNFDKYTYFTEAQYKLLFTELFSKHGLELKFNELSYDTFEGSEKQANGRMPKIEFALMDCETGFFETTTITGEGIDKGDKAGYKAYTGALKYYLADTFMVATGDDPETESPDTRMNAKRPAKSAEKAVDAALSRMTIPAARETVTDAEKQQTLAQIDNAAEPKCSERQAAILREKYTGDNYKKLCYANGVSRVEDIPQKKAAELIEKIMAKEAAK